MSINQYLKRKYGFSSKAKVPTSFLLEELQVTLDEVKQMVKVYLKRKSFPQEIAFDSFCGICSEQLEMQ